MNLFQRRILELRSNHKEIAEALDKPRSSVTAWINGSRRIPKDLVEKFALVLEINLKDIEKWNKAWEKQISRRERMELARKTAHHRSAKITRKEIDDAVSTYLAAGGTIKQLNDGPEATQLEKEIESIGGMNR